MRNVEILLVMFFAVASVLFLLFSALIKSFFSIVSKQFTVFQIAGAIFLILLLILIGIREESSK